MLIFLTSLVLFCICTLCCLLRPSAADLEQAALLPFADDPDAARRMSAETGRHCEHLMTPIFEVPDTPANFQLDA